jgi:hypothetical protein
MVRVCVPTVDVEIEEKVRIGTPEVVLTVTKVGVVPLSFSVTIVYPQIEDVVDEPYNLF